MKALSALLSLPLLFFLFVQVASLEIIVQPQTLVGGTSLVFYSRDANDPQSFTFDLYFTDSSGSTNEGLASSNIVVTPGQTIGVVPVVFPAAGMYTIKAVAAGSQQVLATSNLVTAVAPLQPLTPAPITPVMPSNSAVPISSQSISSTPTASLIPSSPLPPSTTPTPTPTPTSVHAPRPTHSSTTKVSSQTPLSTAPHPAASTGPASQPVHRRSVNMPAVVGGVIGGLVFAGLVVALIIFITRRRKGAVRRYTFHQDMMVQSQHNDVDPSVPRLTIVRGNTASSIENDLETGSGRAAPPVPPKLTIPAAAMPPLRHDLERPHSPITPRTKRNFPGVSSKPSALAPAPLLPRTLILNPSNPFLDNHKEPNMVQVPPLSPRVPSSALVVPVPRGPRPSIKRVGNWSGSDLSLASSSSPAGSQES